MTEQLFRQPTKVELEEAYRRAEAQHLSEKITLTVPNDCHKFLLSFGKFHLRAPKIAVQVSISGETGSLDMSANVKCSNPIPNDSVCETCVLRQGIRYEI